MSPSYDSYNFSDNFPIRLGLFLMGLIGFVSLVSSCTLLFLAMKSDLHAAQLQKLSVQSYYVGAPMEPVDKLFRCLVLSDAVEGISCILISHWAFKGKVVESSYCQVQAAIRQTGIISVTLCTLAIATLTFVQVVRPLWIPTRNYRLVSNSIIAGIVGFLVLMIAVPASAIPHYYGNTGVWCWVSGATDLGIDMRIIAEHTWILFTALITFIFYGYIIYKWIKPSPDPLDQDIESRHKNAMMMIWFPLACFVVITPASLVRFLVTYRMASLPGHGWLIFASLLRTSSGWINALLWLCTGRRFGFGPVRDSPNYNVEHVAP